MDPELICRRIHERTNVVRQSNDRLPLASDPDLKKIAQYHSRRMAARGRIFHEAPDGETLSDRLNRFDYDPAAKASGQPYCYDCGSDLRHFREPAFCPHCGVELATEEGSVGLSGENVASIGVAAPKSDLPSDEAVAGSVVDGWLDSPGHRANLLKERFERMAIGVALAEETGIRVYITQNFS